MFQCAKKRPLNESERVVVLEKTAIITWQKIYFARREYPLNIFVMAQFYIQLIYKPHCGTETLLFGLFGQLRVVSKKYQVKLFIATLKKINFSWVFLIKKNVVVSAIKSCLTHKSEKSFEIKIYSFKWSTYHSEFES